MADTEISALIEDASPGLDSLIVTVDDPGGTPVTRRSTLQSVATLLDANLGFIPEVKGLSTNTADRAANTTIIQNLLTAGTPVRLPVGIFPVNELTYPHNAVIIGHGFSSILQFNGANGLTPADLTNGAVMPTFLNFAIDGGWTPSWGTDPSTLTAHGLYLLSDIDTTTTNATNSDAGLGDHYGIVHGVLVQNVAGDGIVVEGRGEFRIDNCTVDTCGRYGVELACFDWWFTNNSISVCGQECLRVGVTSASGEQSGGAGNGRASNNKYWFNGRSTFSAPAACVHVVNAGHLNSDFVNENIQDTQGPAIELNGDGISWRGSIDAPFRLNQHYGFGLAPTLTDPVVFCDDLRDSRIEVTISDSRLNADNSDNQSLRPLEFGVGATQNHVELQLVQQTGKSAWWDAANVVTADASTPDTNRVVSHVGERFYNGAFSDVSYEGAWDASGGAFPGSGAAQAGFLYRVSTGGTVDSVTFAAGDLILALTNDASTSTYAANWQIIPTGVASGGDVDGGNAATQGDAIQVRRDTAANFTSNNPTLVAGEIGFETNTGQFKIGDGSTAWTSLDYISVASASIAETDTGTETGKAVTPDGLAGSYAGTKSVIVEAFSFSDGTSVATGNGAAYFTVPDDLDGMNLVGVRASHLTAGAGTGVQTTTIQIHNVTDAADMLSTALTIDEDEVNSATAATAAVIDAAADDVAALDIIRIDVDAIPGTTAPVGLQVILEFRLP